MKIQRFHDFQVPPSIYEEIRFKIIGKEGFTVLGFPRPFIKKLIKVDRKMCESPKVSLFFVFPRPFLTKLGKFMNL